MPQEGAIRERLENMLEGLEERRETHKQWRDCDQVYRDQNPSIGDSDFHAHCVEEYDEYIDTVQGAMSLIDRS